MSIFRRGLVNLSISRQSLNAPGYKELLYYVLVTRHSFDGYPPLPVAEYTTSDRAKDSIYLFLSQIQKNLLGLINLSPNMRSKLIMIIVMSVCNSHLLWGIKYFNEKLPWYHRNKELKKIVLKSLGCRVVCTDFFIVKTIVKLVYYIVNLSLLNIWSNCWYSRKQLTSTMRDPLMQSIYFTMILQKLQICNSNLMMQWEPILKSQKNTWWSHVGFHPSGIRFFNKNTLIKKAKKNKESVLFS